MSQSKSVNAAFNSLQKWLEPMQKQAAEASALDKQTNDAIEATETKVTGDATSAIKDPQVKKSLADAKAGSPDGTHASEQEEPGEGGIEAVDGKKGVGDAAAAATLGGAEAPKSLTNVKVETSEMEQKQARAERLGQSIIREIQSLGTQKQASVNGLDKEAAAWLEKTAAEIDKEAQEQASLFYQYYKAGRAQRIQDEMEMKEAGIDQKVLEQAGGIAGLLDKVAMEDPAAVLPEELAAEVMPAEGAAPEMGMGDDAEAEAVMAEIGQLLEASGVTPEELDQIMQQLIALKQNGFSDEEIMAALEEMAMEEQGAGAPVEAPVEEEIPAEQKEAASRVFRSNVDTLKNFWRGR